MPVRLVPDDNDSVALQIRHGEMVDTVISTMDEPPCQERAVSGGYRMRGRLGIVREKAGKPVAGWLFEGESLIAKGMLLKSQAARYEGIISAATRIADGASEDAFITNADLPSGDALAGKWMIVTHGSSGYTHGYQIKSVERREGKTIIILTDDHGLKIEGDETKEIYFPRRIFKGANRFRIPIDVAKKE
jgi:hypothetical protein